MLIMSSFKDRLMDKLKITPCSIDYAIPCAVSCTDNFEDCFKMIEWFFEIDEQCIPKEKQDNYYHDFWDHKYKMMDQAAKDGLLSVVQWLHINKPNSCTSIIDWAAGSGHLKIVVWLDENSREGCSTNAIDEAGKNGKHQRYREIFSTNAIDEAAKNGHRDIVKYLHRQGKSCTKQAGFNAAINGHLAIVQFLFISKAIPSIIDIVTVAYNYQQWVIIEYFYL